MTGSKKVFVTGGTGFIGRHVCDAAAEAHDVTAADIREAETPHKFMQVDISKADSIPDLSGYDSVLHLAAMLGVANTENNPIPTLDVNIGMVRNILEACRKSDVKNVVFSSSSEVYGEPAKVPIKEEDFFNPVSPYGVSKIAGEEYIKSFSRTYGINFNILRLFSVYGPGQAPNFVIPIFVKNAMEGKPLTLHGDGKQVRSFCYVGDIARAMRIALENPKNDVFNIGNSKEPIKMDELAKKVIDVTGSSSKIEIVSLEDSGRGRAKDILTRIPDTIKARDVLGFEAEVTLNDGIKKVAESLKL